MKVLRKSLLIILISIGLVSCASTRPAEYCLTKDILGAVTFTASDGQAIHAVYCSNGTVALTFSDGTREVLAQATSASGARYASDNHEWWEHQSEATYSIGSDKIFVGKNK